MAAEAHVLVVDDNEINLDVFQALLKRTKIRIATADSGRSCLELAKRERFHIIFMDHMMPKMDGVETLRELRKLADCPNENTPVIALTANALPGAREFYLKEGFADVLTKPVDPDLLEELVASYLPEKLVKVNEAETISEDAFQREEFGRLEQTGFHTGSGLRYCHGDSGLYGEMLVRFAKSAGKKAADMEAAFQSGDIQAYRILVHTLKSSSKMIGADRLSELAGAAEAAAKGRDLAYIRENHGALIGQYQEAAQCISGVFGLADESGTGPAGGTAVSGEMLLSRLSELREKLGTFEADRAETILAEMSEFTYQGASVRQLLREVGQDVEDFELGAAAEKVERLIAGITPR